MQFGLRVICGRVLLLACMYCKCVSSLCVAESGESTLQKRPCTRDSLRKSLSLRTHVKTHRGRTCLRGIDQRKTVVTMSIHIVALGSECPGGARPGEEAMGQGQLQGGLLWSYLGHGAVAGGPEETSLSNSAFMEYTSRVFGDVTVVVQDCPSWVCVCVCVCVCVKYILKIMVVLKRNLEEHQNLQLICQRTNHSQRQTDIIPTDKI
ncbi:unnamed protein product [Oncorhynchus mykiss]|uniref:Uncharacterized protein n=1 Tax=Oncorhynchus mykiss TaxID=8022 RepID=A0A060X2L7_ONCMY|nr:unnamed protein product [Oncorhynchus mykiss]